MDPSKQSECWVVTDGKAGMESQCVGLAAALGFQPAIKRIRLRTPWRQFSPFLHVGLQDAFSGRADQLVPPWPDLLIASGRQSVPASLYVRRVSSKAGKATVTIQIQNPGIDANFFDFIVTPAHDALAGANVITTLGALHGITPQRLKEAAIAFAPRIAPLPAPYLALLVGGPNRAYRFTTDDMSKLTAEVGQFAKRLGFSLLVTPSRRTGAENISILKRVLADVPAFIWDMESPNPYFGILGLADALIVTPDSINMVTEACSTGRPVLVYELPGGSPKFDRFHRSMKQYGYTQAFDPNLEKLENPPERLDEMTSVAREIIALANKSGLSLPVGMQARERVEAKL